MALRSFGSFGELREGLTPRPVEASAEREMARVAATLRADDPRAAAKTCRTVVYDWLRSRIGEGLPPEAARHHSFLLDRDGLACEGLRVGNADTDHWAVRLVRAEPPGSGRRWITELGVRETAGKLPAFRLRRLLPLERQNAELAPKVPEVVAHLASLLALEQDGAPISGDPWLVDSEAAAERLGERLADPDRESPVIVLSVPERAEDPRRPLLAPAPLARDTAGLAAVVVLPAHFTWNLTHRFGKRLAVYRGAIRVYLPGFPDDANERRHRLIMGDWLEEPGAEGRFRAEILRRVAEWSVRHPLEWSFAAVREMERRAVGARQPEPAAPSEAEPVREPETAAAPPAAAPAPAPAPSAREPIPDPRREPAAPGGTPAAPRVPTAASPAVPAPGSATPPAAVREAPESGLPPQLAPAPPTRPDDRARFPPPSPRSRPCQLRRSAQRRHRQCRSSPHRLRRPPARPAGTAPLPGDGRAGLPPRPQPETPASPAAASATAPAPGSEAPMKPAPGPAPTPAEVPAAVAPAPEAETVPPVSTAPAAVPAPAPAPGLVQRLLQTVFAWIGRPAREESARAALRRENEELKQRIAQHELAAETSLRTLMKLRKENEDYLREWEKADQRAEATEKTEAEAGLRAEEAEEQAEESEERAEEAEAERDRAVAEVQRLSEQLRARGVDPHGEKPLPADWHEFADWCQSELNGRLTLLPAARRRLKRARFADVRLAARCLRWLAGEYRDGRMRGKGGHATRHQVERGVHNIPAGGDAFSVKRRGRHHRVDWHIKNGGTTRDPARCLRIYYFWDPATNEVVVAAMPAHIRSDSS